MVLDFTAPVVESPRDDFPAGVLVKATQHLMLIKTLPDKWEDLRDFIAANHSYETPEIVAIDAERVAEKYRTWIDTTLA